MNTDQPVAAISQIELVATGSDGLSVPRRHFATLSVWLSVVVVILNDTIVTVALPSIAAALDTTAASSIWVVNAYQAAILVVLLPLATLGDLLGYRRIYCFGIALTGVATLACALAPDLASLVVLRFLQGLGAAGILAVHSALFRFIVPDAMLARMIGYNALVVALCSTVCPAIAAFLLNFVSWRWLFVLSLPFAVCALLIGLRALPASPRSTHAFDFRSALLTACTFGSLFFGASALSGDAPTSTWLPALVLGMVLGFVLLRRELRAACPLVPLDLIRIPILRLSYVTSLCAFASMMTGTIALPFILRGRFGFGHVETGVLISSIAIGVGVAAPFSGHLMARISAARLGGVGLALSASGWAFMALVPVTSELAPMVVAMVVCGVGVGIFQTPNNRTMIGCAPRDRSGAGGGMISLARLGGQICGALLVATLFRFDGLDTTLTMLGACALCIAGALISLRRTALGSSRVGR